MTHYYTYDTILGSVTFVEENGALVVVTTHPYQPKEEIYQETPVIKEAFGQLSEYFSGKRKTFNLPLLLKGTDFQKQVWQALLKIPFGETRSYKQIAETIGNPKAVRAVGMANNKNPFLIIVPCHRVIGANGKLVGYAVGLDKKEYLLRLEGSLL